MFRLEFRNPNHDYNQYPVDVLKDWCRENIGKNPRRGSPLWKSMEGYTVVHRSTNNSGRSWETSWGTHYEFFPVFFFKNESDMTLFILRWW